MNQIKFHKRLGLILDEIYDIFNSSTRQEQLNALLLKKLTDSKLKLILVIHHLIKVTLY